MQTSAKWNLFQLCRVQPEEGVAKLRPKVNVTIKRAKSQIMHKVNITKAISPNHALRISKAVCHYLSCPCPLCTLYIIFAQKNINENTLTVCPTKGSLRCGSSTPHTTFHPPKTLKIRPQTLKNVNNWNSWNHCNRWNRRNNWKLRDRKITTTGFQTSTKKTH